MTMEVSPERSRAVLTLTLVTPSATPVEATLDLVLPADARATGLVARIAGESFPGVAMPAYEAERLYGENAPYLDPALLELVDAGDTTQTLALRASPLTRAHAATIEIELDLPAGAVLAVGPGVGVTPRVTMTKAKTTASRHPGVEGYVDLYAGPQRVAARAYVEPRDAIVERAEPVELSEAALQAVMTAHQPALRACFLADHDRARSLVGAARIHATVTKAGQPGDVTIVADDESDQVRACLRDEVAAWTFPQTDDVSIVNVTAAVVLP